MKLLFTWKVPPLELTIPFEEQYEPTLGLTLAEKRDYFLHEKPEALYLYVDGELAGEIYSDYNPETCELYVASVTILPKFQGKGLSKVMFAYMLGDATPRTTKIVWHSTSPGMDALSDFFGAESGEVTENWSGTTRRATHRWIIT
jgi:GNAT superfamily N-acetyltransferase